MNVVRTNSPFDYQDDLRLGSLERVSHFRYITIIHFFAK